jgi:hypothetical protein
MVRVLVHQQDALQELALMGYISSDPLSGRRSDKLTFTGTGTGRRNGKKRTGQTNARQQLFRR